ncbi:hypothetical protein CK203_071368 [Vitis vinifera]|uniref:Uncharacterized protein n=1 Tax=Vitis vinifera TaxID=29760 RepID=A0A438ETK1_VITVI|nr:hypothetical protein CK203_071368 [Vitis vinifera]
MFLKRCDGFSISADMQHMDLNMSIHRVFTILIQASNTFRYMGCLGRLIQLFILMDNWVRLFPAVMVIQRYRVMQCQVISSCNLVGPVSMPYQHRLFQQFRHPILQAIFSFSNFFFLFFLMSFLETLSFLGPPFPDGIAAPVPAQPQFIVPAHSPQFIQGSGPDQTTGIKPIIPNRHMLEIRPKDQFTGALDFSVTTFDGLLQKDVTKDLFGEAPASSDVVPWEEPCRVEVDSFASSQPSSGFEIIKVIHSHAHQRSRMSESLLMAEKEPWKLRVALPLP